LHDIRLPVFRETRAPGVVNDAITLQVVHAGGQHVANHPGGGTESDAHLPFSQQSVSAVLLPILSAVARASISISPTSRSIDMLLQRQVDGVLYAAMYHRIVRLPESLRSTPTVLLDARCDDSSVHFVVPDEVQGGSTAVRELTDRRHRRIGMTVGVGDIPALSALGLGVAGEVLRARQDGGRVARPAPW
jgi:hypothetical protein